jgi:predicted DNA-binding transcriptional regulator AlpA
MTDGRIPVTGCELSHCGFDVGDGEIGVVDVKKQTAAATAHAAQVRKTRLETAANARRAQLAGLNHAPTVNGDRHDKSDAVPHLLSRPEITALVGFEYPTVWKMMRQGRFPRSRIVGGKSMWISTEVSRWIANLPVRRLKGDAPPGQKIEQNETA